MNVFKIAYKNLFDKPLSSCLSVLLMALGIGIISLLVLLGQQLEDKFKNNIKGVDMVIGAKGSPLQLILASIYQIDSPTGNISLEEANQITRNPLVKETIPLSMGDSYSGYRIVGSTAKYLNHFEAKTTEGRFFEAPLECVVGIKTAQNLGLTVGASFVGTHGYDQEGHAHEEQKYKVVGILGTTNSVLDQLIVTPLESVWAVHEEHEGEHHNEEGEEHHHDEPQAPKREITAMLVKFRNPMGMLAIPRNINANTTMQAALPSIEINRLFDLMGLGISTLQLIALVIIIVSGLSVFVSLYNSLKERKYEMALMLSMGATRAKLFVMLLLEGLMIALLGYVLGIFLSRLALFVLGKSADKNFHQSFDVLSLHPLEISLFLAAIAIGVLAAALPSLSIYKINISRTLAQD
jgi:putative ABC transport system permease protein